MADNKKRGLDVGLEKAYSDIATGVADTVASAASKLKYAHGQGMAGAFGMGAQPSASQPTKIAAQQTPAAPTVPSPAVTAPIGLTSPAVFNPKGARGEGFADVTSPQPQQERGLGGYFNETEWSKAAEELRSIIRGDNPRMRTMWHFEPGVGRYSIEEAVPQSEATKRAAMAHLYGMLPERLRADVGLQEAELRGKYGVAEAGIRAQAAEEDKQALLDFRREEAAREDAREKRRAWFGVGVREVTDPNTLEKTKVFDVPLANRLTALAYGDNPRVEKPDIRASIVGLRRVLSTGGEGARAPAILKLLESFSAEELMKNEAFNKDQKNVDTLNQITSRKR
jgi:hypothetical protein